MNPYPPNASTHSGGVISTVLPVALRAVHRGARIPLACTASIRRYWDEDENREPEDEMVRKKLGQLEAEVLAVLAGAEGYLSTGELLEELDGAPAYTTVNTVLFRLLDKKMVERSQRGRGFVYRLVVDESELAAERMFDHLRVANDPSSVLNQFIHGLSTSEEKALRALLGRREE